MKNNLIVWLLKLPIVILFIIGILFDVPALIAVLCLVLAWYALSYYSFYEELKYKTLLLSSVISAIGAGLLFAILARDEMVISTPKEGMWGISAIFVIVIVIPCPVPGTLLPGPRSDKWSRMRENSSKASTNRLSS